MKNSFKRSLILLTGLFIVLLTITLIAFNVDASRRNDMYLNQGLMAYENQIETTINRYESFSNYIYDTLIDDTVTLIMFEAVNGNDATQNQKRDELYDYLDDAYELTTDYQFRQLHFHMPNGDSFLRMHAPDTYGDNLIDIRPSIAYVNTNLEYIRVFEEGRIYNGYRFVYPLFNDDAHVGSVEISISIATIIELLYDINPNCYHQFIIDETIVSALVFDDYQLNYTQSAISQNYFIDQAVTDFTLNQNTLLEMDKLNALYDLLPQSFNEKLNQGESFSYSLRVGTQYYTMDFLSLKNLNNDSIGYVYTVSIDKEFATMQQQRNIINSAIILFFIITFTLLLFYVKDKHKILLLSRTDQLTKISNRAYFNELAEKELNRSNRYQHPLSYVVMDIDNFKKINDTYGHSTGDQILKALASTIQQSIRKHDLFCRWGGEEFSLLLPETTTSNAVKVCEKIQRALSNHLLINDITVTFSFGVASLDDDTTSLNDLFKRADKNLYHAKETGRDKIVWL